MVKTAKIKFILLLIFVILAICTGVYLLKGEFCITAKDCPDLGDCGIDCGLLCIEHRCTWVSCEDHGTYDFKTGRCICHAGYTGPLCSEKIRK